MSTYFCKYCDNNSWSEPFKDNTCDDCYEKYKDKIVITVSGGVAEVAQNPTDTDIEIVDFDNVEE